MNGFEKGGFTPTPRKRDYSRLDGDRERERKRRHLGRPPSEGKKNEEGC